MTATGVAGGLAAATPGSGGATAARRLVVALAFLLLASAARAADWTPTAWADLDTLTLTTVAPDEEPHTFPVWLVVLDGDVYVRLGTRAAERVQASTTAPFLGVGIGGAEFPRVRGEPAPEMAGRVAAAMADKYWSDVLIRWVSHPLTLRLRPE